MNKKEFINKLVEELSYSEEKCIMINEILESNFFISKKNKDKILDALMQKFDMDELEASKTYDTAVMILHDEIKNTLKHPFKSKD